MKKLLLALGIMALMCSPAMAGRNANGAMLLHVNPNLVYSALQPYCDDVAYPIPTTCDGLVTDDTRDPSVESMIWMVAAFANGASPGVLAFQVGLGGNVDNSWFTDFAPCGPAGFFEIPDVGWPGTGTGTAVAYPTSVHSILFKMYWFACGSPGVGSTLSTTNYYAGDHHAEWADDSTPPVTDFCNLFGTIEWGGPGSKQCPSGAVGACCFQDGTCQVLASADCATAGGAYQGDGTVCDPNTCPQPVGACCFTDGTCRDLNQADCTAAGGAWEGMGTACASFQCPQPVHACCFTDGSCRDLNEADCAAAGGIFHGDVTCETPGFTCPVTPTGACCRGDVCTIETEASCTANGGTYKGDGTTCTPQNPCQLVPTKSTTWGQIKGSYR